MSLEAIKAAALTFSSAATETLPEVGSLQRLVEIPEKTESYVVMRGSSYSTEKIEVCSIFCWVIRAAFYGHCLLCLCIWLPSREISLHLLSPAFRHPYVKLFFTPSNMCLLDELFTVQGAQNSFARTQSVIRAFSHPVIPDPTEKFFTPVPALPVKKMTSVLSNENVGHPTVQRMQL